jgi:hypothetical protein
MAEMIPERFDALVIAARATLFRIVLGVHYPLMSWDHGWWRSATWRITSTTRSTALFNEARSRCAPRWKKSAVRRWPNARSRLGRRPVSRSGDARFTASR